MSLVAICPFVKLQLFNVGFILEHVTTVRREKRSALILLQGKTLIFSIKHRFR